MRRKIKKILTAFLITLVILGRVGPIAILASEIDNTAEVTNEVDSTANTGGNTIQEGEPDASPDASPTPEPSSSPLSFPTPDPTASATPTASPGIGIENTAEVTNDIESTAITGENSIEEVSPSPTPEDSPSPSPNSLPATIETGDAVSVVEVENSVNSTEVESQVIFHTLNIFVPQGQNIDLSTTPFAIANTVFSEESVETEVNVAVLDVNNFAYLTNDIHSLANTGLNEIEGDAQAMILTGDAYSIVSLLNSVNTTIVGSTIHLVTINIFGGVDENILLPELNGGGVCCGETFQISNDAFVANNIDSLAVTGQNSVVTASGSGAVTTGSAQSVVNVVNIVNKSFIGVIFHYLVINNLGSWTGDFLGWDGFGATEGGGSLSLASTEGEAGEECTTCTGETSIQNQAQVVNNVSSSANTGGNSINSGSGTITTGNAYSAVSIFNFVNTSIIRSLGFFGFINIFGSFGGDIGGASLFAVEELPADLEEETTEESGSTQLSGGELDIHQTNNVGTHVLPGDTVTFFVTIRNPGTGPVYGARLRIGLINEEGVDMGGANYDLGDIAAGKGLKVTTGITLSENANPGQYTAHAVVTGYVGPDNALISASSDSFLTMAGSGLLPALVTNIEETQAGDALGEVFGVGSETAGLNREQKMLLVFLGLLAIYLPAKGYQKRRELSVAFSRGKTFVVSKSVALRSFLTSFLT